MAKSKFTKKELKDQKDLIGELNAQMGNLTSGSTEYNKTLIKQNENWAAILTSTKTTAEKSKETADAYRDMVEVVKKLKDGNLSINDIIKLQNKAIKDGNTKAAKGYGQELQRLRTQELQNKALNSADKLTGGMASKAKDLFGTFKQLGPAVGGLVIGLAAAVALLTSFNSQQEAIAGQFGAIGVTRFRSELDAANLSAADLGISSEVAQKSISDLANNFGLSVPDAAKLSESVFETSAALGMSVDESGKLLGTLTTIGGLTTKQATDLAKQAQSLAEANNVAPDEILKAIANNTELFAKYAKDGGANVLRASIQAKKLGLELSDVASSMEGMLDFQGSLNAEIEASVMLGRNLNLQKARELSLSGDIEGYQAEILKQVGSQAQFDKLNVLQKQALAKATNLSVTALSKMVSKEKEAVTLAGEMKKQKISDLVSAESITNTAKLLNSFKALATQLASDLGPGLETMMGVFSSMAKIIIPLVSNVYALGAAIAFLTLKSILNTSATIAQSIATFKNMGAKKLEAVQTIILTTNKAGETIATIAQTTAETANTTAKASKLSVMGGLITTGLAYLATIGAQTLGILANTATTIANTIAKGAATIASFAASAGAMVLAAANFMAGAAAGTLASFGFGGPAMIAMAIAGIAAMVIGISKARSASKAGDLSSPAAGKTQISTKEGGLYEMSKNDDILAAPGLAAAMAGGGGTTNVTNVDTSGIERGTQQTVAAVNTLVEKFESAFGFGGSAAKQIGNRVGTNVNESRR